MIVLWAQEYNNNTLLLAAIRYIKTRSKVIKKVKGKGNFVFNCPYLM